MSKLERCCKCDAATGKAGAGDDSLYSESDGPFCEDCFSTIVDPLSASAAPALQDERAKFEGSRKPRTDIARDSRGRYKNPVTQSCWETWEQRAAIAASSAKPALTDEWIQSVINAAVRDGRLSWLGYIKDEDGKYTIPLLSISDFQFARVIATAAGIKEQP